MKKPIIIGAGLVALLVACFLIIEVKKNSSPLTLGDKVATGIVPNDSLPIIEAKESFFDPVTLPSVVKEAEIKPQKEVLAVVSSHHYLAAKHIASVIGSAGGRKINKVFIVGPNHENIGGDIYSTAKVNWQTPYGLVTVNQVLVDKVLADFNVISNPDAFKNEHSVGTIVPFVAHYFPQAEIVPIIFSSHAGLVEAQEISQWLVDNFDEDSLVIFSTDFSHYLTKEEADKKDDETKQMIIDGAVDRIVDLGNDHVDCPAALAASLLFAQKKNLKTEILWHGNSFDLASKKSSSTTSYFTIKFSK